MVQAGERMMLKVGEMMLRIGEIDAQDGGNDGHNEEIMDTTL